MLAEVTRHDALRQTPVPSPGFAPGVDVWNPLLRITKVCPGLLYGQEITAEDLGILASLMEFGADVDAVVFDGFAYAESYTVTVTKALQKLMNTPTQTTEGHARPPTATMDVTAGVSRQALQPIYSALQTGQAVKDLNVHRLGPGRAPATSQVNSSFAWLNIVYVDLDKKLAFSANCCEGIQRCVRAAPTRQPEYPSHLRIRR